MGFYEEVGYTGPKRRFSQQQDPTDLIRSDKQGNFVAGQAVDINQDLGVQFPGVVLIYMYQGLKLSPRALLPSVSLHDWGNPYLKILLEVRFYLIDIFLADHVSHVGRKKHFVICSLQVSQSILPK